MAQYRKKREDMHRVSFSDIFKSERTLKREAALRKAKTEKQKIVNDADLIWNRRPPAPPSPAPASPTVKSSLTEAAIEAYLENERQRQTAERREAVRANAYRTQAEKAVEENLARDREVGQRISNLIDKYFAYKAVQDTLGEERAEVRQIADQLAIFGVNVELIAQRRESLETHTGRSTTSAPAAAASAPALFIWTEGVDKQLQQLKQDSKPWKEIAEELGRPILEIKSRWRKLKKDAKESDEQAANDEEPALDESYYFTPDWGDDGRKSKEPAKTKAKSSLRHEDSGDSSVDEDSKDRKLDRATSTSSRRRVSFADPLEEEPKPKPAWDRSAGDSPDREVKPSCIHSVFRHNRKNSGLPFRDVLLLHKLAEQYDKEKWLRVSSRFFDKTGKRITPHYVRERIEKDLASGPDVW